MNKFIPLASPDIQEKDIEAVNKVLRSGMLVQGKEVAAFEEAIAAYTASKQVIASSNGTSTMHLALCILEIGPGDEVIVPAFSYIATANVVELVGATPIFVDIQPETFNIDPQKIEEAITDKTKAIIPVHEFGLPCDIDEIVRIAHKHQLAIIEDAACALGATFNNQHVGTFGEFGSFSLHPRKAISSGEGGLITTSNTEYAEKARILRNHGIQIENNQMNFVAAGFNYRMTDFQAALVNSQFKRFEKILEKKRQLADQYLNEIKHPAITLPITPENRTHSWQTFHIVLDESIDRDSVISALREKGIGTNYGAQCIPAQEFYQKKYGLEVISKFPHAMNAYKNGIALPLYEKLSKEDISYIAEALNKI
jgi:dTDP-4-amino-4,6-dideoxygalactose transaminase